MSRASFWAALAAIALLVGGAVFWLSRQSQPNPDQPQPGGDSSASQGVPEAEEPWLADARQALQRGIEYLALQQAAAGGWHSDTYGTMKGGGATTALVVYALSHVPEPLRAGQADRLQRGMQFLLAGVPKKGYVTDPDGSSEFPTYATAMTLSAAQRLNVSLPPEIAARMTQSLIAAQVGEVRGYQSGDPHYGGWDMVGGQAALVPGVTPGTNTSVSSFALEALWRDNSEPSAAARRRGDAWLQGCQNLAEDGGFFFSPAVGDASNKAGWRDADRTSPRSYGTTTADGLRALGYCGADPAADPRISAAAGWLIERETLPFVPGFESLPEESPDWATSLRFYYAAALAKCFEFAPDLAAARREQLAAALVKLQRDDGRWENVWPPAMREDDPLIATPLAIVALAECLRELP